MSRGTSFRYASVCSGIESASVAWEPLGWVPACFSEIDNFPRAVLEQRHGAAAVGWDYRHSVGTNATPLFGDFTQIEAHHVGPVDLLVGGTPCQDFSVAGLRAGIAGDRGNLTLEFVRLAARLRPRWVVWENVPGVLSSDNGRAFGAFLGGLAELGYGFAYRVLDAQFFGLAQRRERVFVVANLGDWRRAGAVLFERECLSGAAAPRRAPEEAPAGTLGGSAQSGGYRTTDLDNIGAFVIPLLEVGARTGVSTNDPRAGIGIGHDADPMFTLQATKQHGIAFVFETRFLRNGRGAPESLCPPLKAESGRTGKGDAAPMLGMHQGVRRLTPREWERLQGFRDDYTLIPYRGRSAADGPRYKALGNSKAVPVVRWIGRRIQMVEDMT